MVDRERQAKGQGQKGLCTEWYGGHEQIGGGADKQVALGLEKSCTHSNLSKDTGAWGGRRVGWRGLGNTHVYGDPI